MCWWPHRMSVVSSSQARPDPAARELSKVRPLTRKEIKLTRRELQLKDGRYLVAYSRQEDA